MITTLSAYLPRVRSRGLGDVSSSSRGQHLTVTSGSPCLHMVGREALESVPGDNRARILFWDLNTVQWGRTFWGLGFVILLLTRFLTLGRSAMILAELTHLRRVGGGARSVSSLGPSLCTPGCGKLKLQVISGSLFIMTLRAKIFLSH